ncbi:MAG: helix-turn-helix transcriptional regulator [Phycisphaeraceae bacterium]
MAENYGRIHRLLKILSLIQAQTGWNARRLAEECDTSVRNIYRDLRMLEGAGIPYFYDEPTRGYRVRGDFFLPPVQLTFEESLALVAMAGQIADGEQIPFFRPAARALAKVRGQIPSQVRTALDDLDGHIEVQLAASSSEDGIEDVYERVRRAIASRRKLRCSYDSLSSRGDDDDGQREVFLFAPYCLFFGQRAWYAIGYHEGRSEVRCLRLSRFTTLEVTSRPYAVPEGFTLQDHLGQAWRMIRGTPRYDVELHFDPDFAETIADTHWHDTQRVEWQDDDSIRFFCQVDGLEEIVWWVLSMGPHCRVVQPRELAEQVRDLAAAVAAQYPAPTDAEASQP